MKRIKPALLILTILLSFTILIIIYRKSNDTATALSSRQPKYRVYLITMDQRDQHWYRLNDGAARMAGFLGIEYLWVAPENRDNTKQIELIYQAVEDGADLILLAANDPVAISTAIEDAKAKGVLFIYVDSPAYEEAITTLATNNFFAGNTAAETMLEELEARNIGSGSIGIIGVSTATNSTMNRELGFRSVIERDGSFKLLDTVYLEGDPTASETSAAQMIAENSDLVGLFGTNEGSTEGVGKAIRANKPEIIGIGFDQSEENLALLRDGSLITLLAQNPYTMGYLGMAQAYAVLEGLDTGPQELNTGISIMRRR